MPNRIRRNLIASLALLVAWPGAVGARPQPHREVLAFYYGWYGKGGHKGPFPETPTDGDYDSLDPETITRQVAQARAAGITGLIASWWGQEDQTDKQLSLLLEVCQSQGMRVSVYIERADSPQTLCNDSLYICRRYTSHPAWLTCDGKPVLFYFDRLMQNLGREGWLQARARIKALIPGPVVLAGTANSPAEIKDRKDLFDLIHIYSMQFELARPRVFRDLWQGLFYRDWVKAQKGATRTTATILPGYDDRLLPDRMGKRPVVKRLGGRTFRSLWHAAIEAHPDWILIVSFNEMA